MAGWTTQKELLRMEIKQREEEGCDVRGFAERFARLGADPAAVESLYDELMALPIAPDFPYEEPQTLEGIRAARPAHAVFPKPASPIAQDRFLGAWLGRACGCALGKPVETGCFMGGKDGVRGWELVKRWFEGADAYPIRGYTPHASRAAQDLGIALSPWCTASERETISFMESDDDIRYTVLGLKLLEEKGLDFTTLDVADLWLNTLPYNMACTAERQAYRNLSRMPDLLPERGDPAQEEAFLHFVRTYRNPYREWIGAQIRGDYFGYINPGDPEAAADMAWRDASISHIKNGVYGEMFVAAMLAEAAVTTDGDVARVIETGLKEIPETSRLYEAIRGVISDFHAGVSQEDAFKKIHEMWDEYTGHGWCHTISNAMIVAASLLYGQGDYGKSACMAVQTGFDTDCNGATVGSIVGMLRGLSAIPEYWTKPFNDTLHTSLFGFTLSTISDMAEKTLSHIPGLN